MSRPNLLLILLVFISSTLYAGVVTFVVIPDTIPSDSTIYIAGNLPELGEWYPDRIALEYSGDDRWQKSLTFVPGTRLEFKFTRGSWDNEAIDENAIEFANFGHVVQGDTTLVFRIPGWRDLQQGIVTISRQRFQNKIGRVELVEDWRFKAGDDTAWALQELDDSRWEWKNPQIPEEERWFGIGWFRKHVQVDSSLLNKPLGLYFRQTGASEIFLNGRKIYSIGTVAASEDDEIGMIHRDPMMITFSSLNNVIAVRHSNFSAERFENIGIPAGFQAIIIEDFQGYIYSRTNEVRSASIYQMVFTILPLTLAFIHLLLFIFYKRSRQNLFFALCMIGFAGQAFADFQGTFTSSVRIAILFVQLGFVSINIATFSGLATLHLILKNKLPGYLIAVGIFQFILFSWTFISPAVWIDYLFYALIVFVVIEIIRIGRKSVFKENHIIVFGLAIMIIAIVYQILLGFGFVPPLFGNMVVYVYGILAFSIAVSINLAQEFTTMHLDILHRERVDQEREIQQRLLEADNKRKTNELEEARKLQLSMLPSEIPKVYNLEIAVFMETASEVGGDYYDFYQDDDTLTLAIGDATGHGLRAGILVALVKNIFNSIGRTFYLPDFLNHCARMIKKMNLGNLYMALQIIRIRKYKMIFASAGMPPLLIWRAETGKLEELLHKVLPLGGPDVSYNQSSVDLHPGDTILLMTDGYFELFDDKDEILGLPNVNQYFAECARQPAQQIINHLLKKGKEWSKDRPHKDDITFIVVKIK